MMAQLRPRILLCVLPRTQRPADRYPCPQPRISPITNESELHYPGWKRALKYAVSFAVILLQMLFIGAIVSCLYIGYFVVQSTDMDYVYQVRVRVRVRVRVTCRVRVRVRG